MSQRTNIIAELKAKIQKYTAILEQGKKFNFQPVIDKASKKIQDAKTKLAIEVTSIIFYTFAFLSLIFDSQIKDSNVNLINPKCKNDVD